MNKNLTDLLKKKQTHSAPSLPIDWDARRGAYLEAVEKLYRQIESIFSEAIQDRTVVLTRRTKQLSESYIGTYAVDDLLLFIGDEQIRFSPRGRNVVASEGRVDVIGERGEAMLIVQPDSCWSLVQSRQPRLHTVPLNESSLVEILELVMRDR